MRSEYVCSFCYTCTICNVHVYVRSNLPCVVRSDIVCSLCYIFHPLGLLYLPADVSNNLFLSIRLLCMNFVVIPTLLFVGLRVTYVYLYSFVLTLFSIQYYIYFVILFLFCFYEANNFSGVGVSHFSTSSAVTLWLFLVATPFV